MDYRVTTGLAVRPTITDAAVNRALDYFSDDIDVEAAWTDHELTLTADLELVGCTASDDGAVGILSDWWLGSLTSLLDRADLTPFRVNTYMILASPSDMA